MKESTALVSVKTFSDQGLKTMRSVIHELSLNFTISRLSSVYRVERAAESLLGLRDIRKDERLDCFAVVLELEPGVEAQKTLAVLRSIEKNHQKEYLRRSVSLNLLLYGSEIVMLPSLSLPHPEMHLRPEEIVLATEICGDFRHPVLNESLLELARRFSNADWGEFFAQGSSLLDSDVASMKEKSHEKGEV